MIWGETAQQRRLRRQAWHDCFLWLPKRLIDGRWAWLEEAQWTSYIYNNEVWSGAYFDTWSDRCYRLKREVVDAHTG